MKLPEGLKIIIDLAIPKSIYFNELSSFYINPKINALSFQKFNKIYNSFQDLLLNIEKRHSQEPFEEFKEIESFIKEIYRRERYIEFMKDIKDFIIISFFSNPMVLKNLPITFDEEKINFILEDKEL